VRIELRGIVKRFPRVIANDGIDLTVEPGEIHALLGENGAGKTTLMNILYGLYSPDAGTIAIDGRPVAFASPADAIRAGIGMVHQQFLLVPVLTVTENLMLGAETAGPLGWLDRAATRRRLERLARENGLVVDPDRLVEELPVGILQRVEILRALHRGADCLILDEPTSVLTPQEVDELFAILRRLRAAGTAIVFISHKLAEVMAIADRISVLRAGRRVATTRPRETDIRALARLMVGAELAGPAPVAVGPPPSPAPERPPVLEVDRLVALDDRGAVAADASFAIGAGEIVGLAGVQGNGQTELIEALAGVRPVAGGHVRLDGREVTGASPRALADAGVAWIPEHRQRDGLAVELPVADNLILKDYRSRPLSERAWLRPRAIAARASATIARFDIRPPDPALPARTLSGGNQQKVIVAREFSRPCRLVLAAQPTAGLDVGAARDVHVRLREQRDAGAGVLLMSSDLDEILALTDRVLVMYGGRIAGDVPRSAASRERIGLLMSGAADAHPAGS